VIAKVTGHADLVVGAVRIGRALTHRRITVGVGRWTELIAGPVSVPGEEVAEVHAVRATAEMARLFLG
jgi:hypothetical protein